MILFCYAANELDYFHFIDALRHCRRNFGHMKAHECLTYRATMPDMMSAKQTRDTLSVVLPRDRTPLPLGFELT